MRLAIIALQIFMSAASVIAGDGDDPDLSELYRIKKAAEAAAVARQTAQTAPPGSTTQQQALANLTKNEGAIVEVANKYPNSTVATELAGRSLANLGDYDRAAPLADRGVDLAEKKGDAKLMTQAYLLRGDVDFGRKDYGAALKDAEAVLKLDPKNKAALSLKFQSAGRTGGGSGTGTTGAGGGAGAGGGTASAPGAALSGGTGGIGANSMTPADPRRAQALSTMTPERQKAEGLLREAAQRMNIDPAAAAALADKAVAADPNDPRAYYLRAAARRAAGDLAGAMADLDKTLALDPADAAAHGAKASVSVALGRAVDEVKKEFLASGRNPSEFADYYRDQVAALAGKAPAKDAATGGTGAAPGGPWAAGGGLPARIRKNAGVLIALGLGLVLFGGALLYQTRRRMGDG